MLPLEAKWIGEVIRKASAGGNMRLLNTGSSTLKFRTQIQPHIHNEIFKPLAGNIIVTHLDIKKDEGVDLAGDLMSNEFLQSLRENYDAVLCSNLLEHVENPQMVIDQLEQVVVPGGYLIVTGPRLYPYHNDPIDTMFRPSVGELAEMFRRSKLIQGEIIREKSSHFSLVKDNPLSGIKLAIRILLPFYKFDAWKKIIRGLPSFFREFEVVAVLMQRVD